MTAWWVDACVFMQELPRTGSGKVIRRALRG